MLVELDLPPTYPRVEIELPPTFDDVPLKLKTRMCTAENGPRRRCAPRWGENDELPFTDANMARCFKESQPSSKVTFRRGTSDLRIY